MTQKVFIGKDDEVTFICPECNKSRAFNFQRYKKIEKAVHVKVKCPCGHAYSVLLERRLSIRKNVKMSGVYVNTGNQARGTMKVVDLSQNGLKLQLATQTPDVIVGDILKIEFNLDDDNATLINREVMVRTIREKVIGTEFLSKDHYDKLGAYLLFHLR